VRNQRRFLEEIGQDLGINEVLYASWRLQPSPFLPAPKFNQLSGWYNVSRKQIERRGGSRLFGHHPTLLSALRAAYPTYPWNRDNFSERRGTGRVPRGHWANIDNQKEFIERVGKELGVKEVFATFSRSLTYPLALLASCSCSRINSYTHNTLTRITLIHSQHFHTHHLSLLTHQLIHSLRTLAHSLSHNTHTIQHTVIRLVFNCAYGCRTARGSADVATLSLIGRTTQGGLSWISLGAQKLCCNTDAPRPLDLIRKSATGTHKSWKTDRHYTGTTTTTITTHNNLQ